ncbi:metallophosphoesterase [Roseomonas sp. CAU 1739]|uniref:metallophosphoesterase n=1 Tax=Roseomonas sp. CAU 1739 TaxID=3140364 RepID=UPI00325AB93D
MIPTPDTLRQAGFTGLRVVGDVHGDARGFDAALAGAEASRLFVIQLGDLTDHGPDNPAVLRAMFAAIDEGRGLFILGNHDHKLRRALGGQFVRMERDGLGRTLDQIAAAPDAAALTARAIAEIGRAPAWLSLGRLMFVHAAFHDAMLEHPSPPDAGAARPEGLVGRAIFGQVTGRRAADGFPIRLTGWVDRIPPWLTVLVGHDNRSRDGRPVTMTGQRGGRAIFLDTGAGKGGALAWQDFSLAETGVDAPQGRTPSVTV